MLKQKLNELKKLDFSKQVAFMFLTSERLYPNYLYFSNNFNFGKPSVLQKSNEIVFENIFSTNINRKLIENHISLVENNTPDTEDFSTIFVSSALDACSAIHESLNFLIDRNLNRLNNVSTSALDSVFMYVRYQIEEDLHIASSQNLQSIIESDPLVKKEIEIQNGIINFLNNTYKLDTKDLQTLIDLQNNNNKGTINI